MLRQATGSVSSTCQLSISKQLGGSGEGAPALTPGPPWPCPGSRPADLIGLQHPASCGVLCTFVCRHAAVRARRLERGAAVNMASIEPGA